jgi:hypothetical protein
MVCAIPQWVERMSVGQWYAISGDEADPELGSTAHGAPYLYDNDPARDTKLNPARTSREIMRRALGREPRAPWGGRLGFAAITEAWNGAAFASRYGPSGAMIVFGGGHDDYFGSDVHAFDLAQRTWRRISDGYTTGRDHEYGAGAYYPNSVYPDGSPLPPHTYDYVQYDEIGNDYILFKGQTELGAHVKAIAIPHLFNLDTLRWRRGPEHPTGILNAGGWTTWDASRRVIWGHSGDDGGGNAFTAFCPDGDNGDGTFGRWRDRFPNALPGIANHNAMQIDLARDLIVVAVHARDTLCALDPADPGRPIAAIESAGAKPVLRPYAALEYAPNIDRLVYFTPSDAGVVYSVAGPLRATNKFAGQWTWHAHAPPAGTLQPIAHAARVSRFALNPSHAFGRFRIAAFGTTDVAIVVRHVDTPVYAMRLS